MITVGMPAGFGPPSLRSTKPEARYRRRAAVPSGTDWSKVCTNMLFCGFSRLIANFSSCRPKPMPRQRSATASQTISFASSAITTPPPRLASFSSALERMQKALFAEIASLIASWNGASSAIGPNRGSTSLARESQAVKSLKFE